MNYMRRNTLHYCDLRGTHFVDTVRARRVGALEKPRAVEQVGAPRMAVDNDLFLRSLLITIPQGYQVALSRDKRAGIFF